MGISLLALIGAAVVVLVFLVVGVLALAKGFSVPKRGHVNLSCPHCGKETAAQKEQCQHCGQALS